MVDTRFHASSGPAPLGVLLGAHAEIGLDDKAAGLVIAGADELDRAGPDHIALAAHKDYAPELRNTKAGAVIVSRSLLSEVPVSAMPIVAERPHELFAELLDYLYPQDTQGAIAGMAVAGAAEPILEEGVSLGPTSFSARASRSAAEHRDRGQHRHRAGRRDRTELRHCQQLHDRVRLSRQQRGHSLRRPPRLRGVRLARSRQVEPQDSATRPRQSSRTRSRSARIRPSTVARSAIL
jgi:hypothetical protein